MLKRKLNLDEVEIANAILERVNSDIADAVGGSFVLLFAFRRRT